MNEKIVAFLIVFIMLFGSTFMLGYHTAVSALNPERSDILIDHDNNTAYLITPDGNIWEYQI